MDGWMDRFDKYMIVLDLYNNLFQHVGLSFGCTMISALVWIVQKEPFWLFVGPGLLSTQVGDRWHQKKLATDDNQILC